MITITRGDTPRVRGILTDPDTKARLNLTGYDIWFTVKRRLIDGDTLAIIRKSTDSSIGGITVPDVTDGTFYVSLTSANTNTLEARALIEFFYDVQIRTPTGGIYTVARGKFFVQGEVTQAV